VCATIGCPTACHCAFISVVLHALPLLAFQAPEAPKAEFSAKELRAKLLQSQVKIKSFRVVYRMSDYDPSQFAKGTYLHRIVALKFPDKLYHDSAHGTDDLDWQDDPHRQRVYLTATHLYCEFPVNRTFFEREVEAREGLPGTLSKELFFFATGIWPLEGLRPPHLDSLPSMLRELAVSPEYSTVRDRQERIDGRWCHVLEYAGRDRLWLDAERECALLARETLSRANGALAQRIELWNHRMVAPGIWMPTMIRNIQFDYNAKTEEGRRRKIRYATNTILEIDVNRVNDDLFRFRPPPGALQLDRDRPALQIRPGGLDHLDRLSQWVRRHTSSKQFGSPMRRTGRIPGAAAILAITIAVVVYILRR
jgi:hypothetical protein